MSCKGSVDDKTIVGGENNEHENTVEASDFVVAAGEETDENGRENEHDEVDRLEIIRGDTAGDGDGKGENDTNIENIAADNVADEEVGFTFFRGGNGGDELGE